MRRRGFLQILRHPWMENGVEGAPRSVLLQATPVLRLHALGALPLGDPLGICLP